MKTRVWAHRGASAYAPENTLEAFELAWEMEADGVELDVQMSKDGELIVLHDETLERTTDGKGFAKDYTLKELKQLRAGGGRPHYEAARIPTLKEVLTLLEPSDMEVNIELKTGIFFYPGIEERVMELVRKLKMEDRIWYSSFNHASLRKIKERRADARTGILYADGWLGVPEYARRLGMDALHPALYNLQYPGFVQEARERGLRLHVWTVNERVYMDKLIEAGIDAIITNYPDTAQKAVRAYKSTHA
ncbi:MAG: glycerophosphodiester phosphodiesterase [Eubacteriales bacterium]|nr:glycerophosphodiester phosphodiesterase [Eubacteriales bacterium]